MVYDWPILADFVLNDEDGVFHLVNTMFDKQDYGIAVKEGSQLREELYRAHLTIMENGVYENIYKKYFNGV